MKIAVLSDIHSNVFALKAVLADALARGVKQIVNLGDSFYGPIAPRATFDLLRQHEIVDILGNQDRQIYEATFKQTAANPTLRFVLDDLGEEPLDWMRLLPFDCQLDDTIYMCHGSPTSDMDYLLETIETGYPRLRSDSGITALLNGTKADVILCGHSHIPRCVHLSSGQLVVNPGSVGLPAYSDDTPVPHSMENYRPHASYAVIEKTAAGWIVQQIAVPYAWQKAAAIAAERQRDDWAYFLRTGRSE